ncbi:MAG: hypothetical protein WCJ39_06355 [bacterium]
MIHVDIKTKEKDEEIDFTKTKNEIEITQAQENSDGAEKNIFLSPTIKGKTITLNLVQPEDLKKSHRETTERYKERLREEKELIFLNLRNLSATLNSKNFLLPTTETDESKYMNPIIGPDNNGVYEYKIVNKKDTIDAQHIYLQIQGSDIKLCSSDGKKILEKAFIKEPVNKDYYMLSVENKKLSAKKIDKDQQEKIPEINNANISYMSQNVSIQVPENKITLLNGGTDTYTYGTGGKEMLTVYIDKDKKLDTNKYTKKPDTGLLPAKTDTNRVNFGSYKNYFSLNGDQSLAITEDAYEAAFKETYTKNAEKDAEKTIAQVKMRSTKDGKYYYDYMEIKGSGKEISLNKLKGVEKTKTILKERLAQLIKIKSLKLSTK